MHISGTRISQAYFCLREVQQANDVQQDDNEKISMRKEAVKSLAMVMSQNWPTSTDTKLLKQGCTNFPKI